MQSINFWRMRGLFSLLAYHLLSSSAPLFAQPAGAWGASLARTGSALSGEAWQAHANPAGLLGMRRAAAGVSVHRSALVPELDQVQVLAAVPVGERQVVGLAASHQGFAGYADQRASGVYSIRVAKWGVRELSFGSRVGVALQTIQEFGSRLAWVADVGVHFRALPTLAVAVYSQNANRPRIATGDVQPLPTRWQAGAAWQASPELAVLTDAYWQSAPGPGLAERSGFGTGLSYQPTASVCVRLGAMSGTYDQLTLGGGVALRHLGWQIELVAAHTSAFGTTPSVAVSWLGSAEAPSTR
jgi:hypothetical protein